jgi:hypothetical protein
VALSTALRSLVVWTKEDMVDGPRSVPPVIQWARRAVLERSEEGLGGLLVSFGMLASSFRDSCALGPFESLFLGWSYLGRYVLEVGGVADVSSRICSTL